MVKAKMEWDISVNIVWQKSCNILNYFNNYPEVSMCKKCKVQTMFRCHISCYLQHKIQSFTH